jgi:hypothetical protein
MLSTIYWTNFSFMSSSDNDADKVNGLRTKLSFYKNVQLLKIVNGNAELIPGYYLYYSNRCYYLDGSAEIIMNANAYDHIEINENNVIDYTVFFNEFINAEFGKFAIIDSEDDLISLGINIKLTKEQIDKIESTKINRKIDNNSFEIESTVFYANILAKMIYKVEISGIIEAIDVKAIYNGND